MGPGTGLGTLGSAKTLGEKLVADDVVRHVRRMDNKVIEVFVGVRAGGPCCKVKTRVRRVVDAIFSWICKDVVEIRTPIA
jgi:hypothetical protein